MALGKLTKNTSIYLLGNALNRLGAFVLLPLYTNYLSLEEYGALEIIYAINAVVALFLGAGLAHATLRFYFDKKDIAYRHSVVVTNLIISFGIVCTGALLVIPFSSIISEWLFSEKGLETIVYLALVITIIELNSEVMLAYLRAIENAKLFVVLSFFRLLIQVSVSIYLVGVLELSIKGVLLANISALGVIWLYLSFYTLKRTGLATDFGLGKSILKYSLPFAASGILGTVMVSVDKVLIKEFVGVAEVGIYGLAMKFAMLLTFLLLEPFNRGYGPYRFDIMDQEDAPQTNAKIALYLTTAAVFAGLGVAIFTPLILELFTKPVYFPAGDVTPILVLGVLASGLNYVFQTGILVKKMTSRIFRISVFKALIAMALYFYLIPRMGALGAAIAYSSTNIAMAAMTLYFSQRLYPIPFPFRAMLLTILSGAGLFISLQFINFASSIWMQFAVNIVLLVAYILLVLVLVPVLRSDLQNGWKMWLERKQAR